jgi:CheY-like chemotaxis protein
MERLPFAGYTPNILVIEDNPQDLHLLGEAFAECGVSAHLHYALDAEQALRFLRKEGLYGSAATPDMILLDLNMPRVDGRELLARLVDEPDLRDVRIVVLTSSNQPADIAYCSQLGAISYYTKPTSWEGFLGMVRSFKGLWQPVKSAT